MKVNTSQIDVKAARITFVVTSASQSSPLLSVCSPLAELSPSLFQTLNSLSITNCVTPPRAPPSRPPLLPFVRHWSLGVQTPAGKPQAVTLQAWSGGEGAEGGRGEGSGGMAAETYRETAVRTETEREGRPRRIWINLSLSVCVMSICVLGPVYLWSLIKKHF